jgi:hypothetical protein
MRCCLAIGVLLGLLFHARESTAKRVGAEDVVRMVSISLAIDDDDETNARLVENIQPAEQIAAEAVQVLKSQGAGPRTRHALDELRARSTSLPLPPQPAVFTDAGLDAEQTRALLAKIAEYASGYLSTLPNMSCTETTRFASSGHEFGIRGSRKAQAKLSDGWRLEDTVVEDLDYYEGEETYHTRKLNGAPETRPLTLLRASYSRGEFGTILAMTFDPSSQARFEWDHWENPAGRRVAVFGYAVGRAHSQYSVCCAETGSITVNGVSHSRRKSWISAYAGFVYAEAETGSIVRFTFRDVDIPEQYNLQQNRNLLEYSTVTLGGKSFWVPVRAVHFTRREQGRTRDEIEFANYRKFGAESNISFPTEEK